MTDSNRRVKSQEELSLEAMPEFGLCADVSLLWNFNELYLFYLRSLQTVATPP